jgi:hypothetical protein
MRDVRSRDGLLQQLGPAALVELTACIAFANLSTRTNTVLGITSTNATRVGSGLRPVDNALRVIFSQLCVQLFGCLIAQTFGQEEDVACLDMLLHRCQFMLR